MSTPAGPGEGAGTAALTDRSATTRTAYDAVAVDYARLLADELAAKPLDRALLTTFAEEVLAAGAAAPRRDGGPMARWSPTWGADRGG